MVNRLLIAVPITAKTVTNSSSVPHLLIMHSLVFESIGDLRAAEILPLRQISPLEGCGVLVLQVELLQQI